MARRLGKIDTLTGIKYAMSRVIRGAWEGRIEVHDARQFCTMLRLQADVVAMAVLEPRLAELEQKQAGGKMLPFIRKVE